MKCRNINEIRHEKCVGCTACINACPKHCIKMKMDEEGFLYPIINDNECINCGVCYKSCPTVSVRKQKKLPIILGMINHSMKIRKNSSSGGIFFNLAEWIIESGGCVCAATIDKKMYVKHIMIEDTDRIDQLTKSKYVQSDLGNCYSLIRKHLEQGREVLFVGTPCQVYGLRTFLNKEYNNLFLVDLVCHGVPSPKIWSEFVENIEEQRNSKCDSISFRNKTLEGWKNFGMEIKFSNGEIYIDTQKQNPFMFGFLKGYIDRKCCYSCQFKGMNRCSDLTIGDFWTVDEYLDNFNDNKGTSLVYVNTIKGKNMINQIRNDFYIRRVNERKFEIINNAYEQCSLNIKSRDKFFKRYIHGRKAVEFLNTEMRRSNYE